jgi:hypothetical protein
MVPGPPNIHFLILNSELIKSRTPARERQSIPSVHNYLLMVIVAYCYVKASLEAAEMPLDVFYDRIQISGCETPVAIRQEIAIPFSIRDRRILRDTSTLGRGMGRVFSP